jgi:hypothetical protein
MGFLAIFQIKCFLKGELLWLKLFKINGMLIGLKRVIILDKFCFYSFDILEHHTFTKNTGGKAVHDDKHIC